MDWALGISFFATLIAVIDPIGNLPVFIGSTRDIKPRVQRYLSVILVLFVAIMMLIFLATGTGLLSFFGISLPAFRIAGGISLLIMGLGMLKGSPHEKQVFEMVKEHPTDFGAAKAKFQDILVPVGMPLYVGPGGISVAVLFGSKAANHSSPETAYLVMGLAIVACALTILITLSFSQLISKLLGQLGLNIVTRIMGMILTAMAVQFVLSGATAVMPGVVKSEFIQPGVVADTPPGAH